MPDVATVAMIGTLAVAIAAGVLAWRKAPGEISANNVAASAELVATALAMSQSQTETIRRQTAAQQEMEGTQALLLKEITGLREQLRGTSALLAETQARLTEADAETRAFRRASASLEEQVRRLEGGG